MSDSEVKAPHPGGCPPVITDKIKEIMLNRASTGCTNVDLAELIGVHERTIYKWLADDEQFRHAIKCAKLLADDMVVQSLFNKATGKIITKEFTEGICPKTGDIIKSTKMLLNAGIISQSCPTISAAGQVLLNEFSLRARELVISIG